MPRVALLFEYPTLNGGERSILASIERLRGRFEFSAFAPLAGPLAKALHEAEVDVRPSPLLDDAGRRLPRPLAVSRLVDAIHRLSPDLLHGNSLATGRLTGSIAPQIDAPCTAHLRDIVGLSASAVAELNGNTRLIAVSETTRAFHVDQGLDPSRVVTVHNGVDLDRFRPRPRNDRIRRDLGIPAAAFVALTVGQIGLRKGWDLLTEAAASLAERFPSLHLVLAGERYSDKPETVAYEQGVRDRLAAALPGRAHFVGYRGDMPDLMNAADLLVHPARQEPFGRVLLEAAASGLPIVATAVGGTAELLEDGISASLVHPGRPGALTVAITKLIESVERRTHFAAAARRQVETAFSADIAATRLAELWEHVLSEPRP